jgi:hypothetical protein
MEVMDMTLSSRQKFALGILRHPGQAWRRFRELFRIAAAPALGKPVPTDNTVEVEVISVTSADSLGEKLVDIYARNPSPFVTGPTSLEKLTRRIDRGVRHFLVLNGQGEAVAVTAFDTKNKMFCNSVTDFAYRGKGYQFTADIKLQKLLIDEGYREFCGFVMRRNTRMRRALEAAGWKMEPDPDNPDLFRGRLRVGAH